MEALSLMSVAVTVVDEDSSLPPVTLAVAAGFVLLDSVRSAVGLVAAVPPGLPQAQEFQGYDPELMEWD